MALSAAQLAALTATTLDYYVRGEAFARNIKSKPLLNDVWTNRQSFPGGKELISLPYKEFSGGNFGGIDTSSDDLTFVDFNNDRRVAFPYFEHFAGLQITRQQLSKNGINVGTTNLKGASRATGAEKVQLANLLKSKLEDFGESWSVGMNALVWGNGTADPKAMYGIRTFIVDDPAAALTLGGLSNATYTSWRNIARIGEIIGTAPEEQSLITLIEDVLTDINTNSTGRPVKLKGYIDRLTLKRIRAERRAKNQPSEDTLVANTDLGSSSSVVINGVKFEHDPSMDAAGAGLARRVYIVDHSSIYATFRQGEDKLVHDPESPHNKLVFYKGLLTTGNMVSDRRNTSAVITWSEA